MYDGHSGFRRLLISNIIYFGMAAACSFWLISAYGVNLFLAPLIFVGGLYGLGTLWSCKNLFFPGVSFGAGALLKEEAPYLKLFTQKILRVCGLLLPLPVLMYCAAFYYCVHSFDGTVAAEKRIRNMFRVEAALFRKSVIYSYASNESYLFSSYMELLEERIKSNWHPGRRLRGMGDVLTFTVDPDGNIRNIEIIESAESKVFDDLSLRTVRNTFPFIALPRYKDPVDIQFTFDYCHKREFRKSETSDDYEEITLNNNGVRALNKNDYEGAIGFFKKSLSKNPDYQLAKDNLAITYNNKGLTLRNHPKEALKYFEMALAMNPENGTTRANLDGIKSMIKQQKRTRRQN